jgi:LytR cell envelope-related transcriptional attenuator
VEHREPLPARQPWRSAALIAAVVATVELCILVVLGIVVFGKFFSGQVDRASDPVEVAKAAVADAEAAASGSGSESGAPSKPMLERRETSVIVLNGNGVPGAAAATAERIRSHQYQIAATDNAPRSDFARSLVMYRPGYAREARRLAGDFGVRRVSPLDGLRVHALQGAHVAFIIGAR